VEQSKKANELMRIGEDNPVVDVDVLRTPVVVLPPAPPGSPDYNPCPEGMKLFNGLVCVSGDTPTTGEITGSRILDWEVVPGINWMLVAGLVLGTYILSKKMKGGR